MDSDLSSSELPQNDTATNVVLATGPEKYENKNCFYALRDRRKGLVFQSLRKVKGIFDVFVQVKHSTEDGFPLCVTKNTIPFLFICSG